MKLIASISLLSALVGIGSSGSAGSAGCSVANDYQITFYGYPDNSPPGPGTAYSCDKKRPYKAGGVGTYADPVTMASAEGEFKQCEIVYLPILKKYARYEDECEQCTSDWSKSTKHIDVWIGSSTKSGGDTQEDCENNLTPDGTWSLLKSPPQTLPVSADPLFTPPKNCSTRLVWPSNKATC